MNLIKITYGNSTVILDFDSTNWFCINSKQIGKIPFQFCRNLRTVCAYLWGPVYETHEAVLDDGCLKNDVTIWNKCYMTKVLSLEDNCVQWETDTVVGYVKNCGDFLTDVSVRIGCLLKLVWCIRTESDSGENDASDTWYSSREVALDAAKTLATERHYGKDGENAVDVRLRCLSEIAGKPSRQGQYCVYFISFNGDGELCDQYDSFEAASAAAEFANIRLRKRYPKSVMLSRFEVREV